MAIVGSPFQIQFDSLVAGQADGRGLLLVGRHPPRLTRKSSTSSTFSWRSETDEVNEGQALPVVRDAI
jgi:hypothetical protein